MKKITLVILCIVTLTWMACDNENCYPIACEIQPPTNEVCAAYFENWFYNTNTNACELIGYSGCESYGFGTQTECETCICNPEPPCYPAECEVEPPTDDPCDGIFQEWFYNTETDNCELIEYSGCGGHGFQTQVECESCICNSEPTTSALDGDWHLVSVVCLCPPVELNVSESVWTFDVANNELVVVNNVATQVNMLESGTYEVDVDEANSTISEIFGLLCNYEFQDDNETLNLACEVEVDGPWYRLVRGN